MKLLPRQLGMNSRCIDKWRERERDTDSYNHDIVPCVKTVWLQLSIYTGLSEIIKWVKLWVVNQKITGSSPSTAKLTLSALGALFDD